MKQILLFAGACLMFVLPLSLHAAEVTAQNTLMRGAVISPDDIRIVPGHNEDHDTVMSSFIGMQINRTVYAGHKLTLANLEPPTLVKRNSVVTLTYEVGGLTISTYGRALGEGSQGDIVDVMNVDSKIRIKGIITGPDMVNVR